ncbi:MAG: TPM domain-containing protein [Cytophagaceae bacterium]
MRRLIIFFSLSILCFQAGAQSIPDRKSPLVNDFADILTDGEEASLNRKLKAYNVNTGSNIEIVTVSHLEFYEVNEFAQNVAKKWGIDKNPRTVILLTDMKDRKYGLFRSKDLSAVLTEDLAFRLEEKFIKPNFREQQYFRGLNESSDVIMDILSGRYKPEDVKSSDHAGTLFIIIFFMFLFLFVFLPIMQYRSVKKSHLGSKELGVFATIGIMATMNRGSSAVYEDFSKGKGKFASSLPGLANKGGGGASGSW